MNSAWFTIKTSNWAWNKRPWPIFHLSLVEGFSIVKQGEITAVQCTVTHWRCTSPMSALFRRWCLLWKYSSALFRKKSVERVYVCVRESRQKNASTKGDGGFTAGIKMESILGLESHSSTVWGPACCVSLPLLFQSLPFFPPLLCFNCSAFPSLHCLYNFLLSSVVTPRSFPFLLSPPPLPLTFPLSRQPGTPTLSQVLKLWQRNERASALYD